MGAKQTRVQRVTTEDVTAAWIIEHRAAALLLLLALLGLACAGGAWLMELQLYHAGLL